MDLAVCRRATKYLPYDENSGSYRYSYDDLIVTITFDYEIIGEFANATALVLVTEWEGMRRPYVNSLAIIEGLSGLTPGDDATRRVRLTSVRYFGDRCNGGLQDVAVTGPHTYKYSERMTSFALMMQGKQGDQGDWLAELIPQFAAQDSVKYEPRLTLVPGEALEDFATLPCVGFVSVGHNMVTGQDTIINYTVDRPRRGPGRYQRCFGETAERFPAHLSVDDLKKLTALFVTHCVSPHGRGSTD